MLSPEQRAMRLTGIGASELAAIADLHPYRGAIDVWMAKPRPGGLPPLIAEDDEEDRDARAEVGDALEEGLRQLYTKRTGIALARAETLRHPEHSCILATPDGLGVIEDVGTEIKVVGSRMAHHWAEDTVPDYVLTQAVGGMAVTGRARWDVCALVGGTDFRIVTVERDLALEEATIEAAVEFWTANVLAGVAPEPRSIEERKRYLRTRYPGSSATATLDVSGREEIAECVRWLAEAQRRAKVLDEAVDALKAMLLAEVGDEYGIEAEEWGKFIAPKIQGRVDWKACAYELDGTVPLEIIEKHRGDPFRQPRLIPPSKKAKRTPR